MAWNNCIIHVILAIVSYILWFMAGLSGAIYLIIQGAQSSHSIGSSPRAKQALQYWETIRYRLTCAYLILGLIFLTGGVFVGFQKANIYWGNYRLFEMKIIFSFITLLYYLVVVAMIPILKLRKHEPEALVSILAVYGLGFMAVNLLLNNFSRLHHYL